MSHHLSKLQHGQYYGDRHHQLPAVVVTLVDSTTLLADKQQQQQKPKERRKSLILGITAAPLSSTRCLSGRGKMMLERGKYIHRSLSLNSLFLICNFSSGRPKIISVHSVIKLMPEPEEVGDQTHFLVHFCQNFHQFW